MRQSGSNWRTLGTPTSALVSGGGCPAEALRATAGRHCPVRASPGQASLRVFIPGRPAVMRRLSREARRPNFKKHHSNSCLTSQELRRFISSRNTRTEFRGFAAALRLQRCRGCCTTNASSTFSKCRRSRALLRRAYVGRSPSPRHAQFWRVGAHGRPPALATGRGGRVLERE
jgi:hypothetical protein